MILIDIFDRARAVTAHEVAEREGLRPRQRGTRWWVRCPLHSDGAENTASLCLYSDGGWYCFGCGKGGQDGTSLFAALRGITQLEAARLLTELSPDQRPAKPANQARRLRRLLEGHRIRRQIELSDVIHGAQAVMDAIQERAPTWDACWDDPLFVAALEARSAAVIEYEQLALASPEELLQMAVRNEVNERSA